MKSRGLIETVAKLCLDGAVEVLHQSGQGCEERC